MCAAIPSSRTNTTVHEGRIRFETQSLQRQFGEATYDQFVKRFLEHEGCSGQQIDEIVDNQKNGPLLRQVAAIEKNADLRSRRFAVEVRRFRDRWFALNAWTLR